MADRSNFFIMQLFHEMKQRFPAIPDRVISECIRQNFNNKEICEAVLNVKNCFYSSYSRLFPSPHMPKMLPTSSSGGGSAVSATETSSNESVAISSICNDNSCVTSGSSAKSEAERSDKNEVVQERLDSFIGSVTTSQDPVPSRTSSSTNEASPGNESQKTYSEAFEVPTNFRLQLSQTGCGRGIGGGCCCRDAENVPFHGHYQGIPGMINGIQGIRNIGQQPPIDSPVLPSISENLVTDGLGDESLCQEGREANSSTRATGTRSKYSSYLAGGVSVPGVRPPPTHLPDNVFERTFQQMHDLGPASSVGEMPNIEPVHPIYNSPYLHTIDRESYLDSNHDGRLVVDFDERMSHEVRSKSLEDLFVSLNCRLSTTTGGAPNFQDCKDEARFDISGKGQTTTSSTVKVSASSPISSPSKWKQANMPVLQPTPVFAGQSHFQGMKDSPPFMGRPTTPTNHLSTSVSPTSLLPMETPLSYRLKLRVIQPSSDPLPPIDIRSSSQSELQIRIGGSGMSSSSCYGPLTNSSKSQPPPPSGKNVSPNQPNTSHMHTQNQNNNPQFQTNRSGKQQFQSPLTPLREQGEWPPYPGTPLTRYGNIPSRLNVGSVSDDSKAHTFDDDDNKDPGAGARYTREHHPRTHPNISTPSSSGFPPLGPTNSQPSGDIGGGPQRAPSPSSHDHTKTTCKHVSQCRALLVRQIFRKSLLEEELNKERAKLKSMQDEARMMEKDLRQREMQQSSHATFPIIQRVHTLRQEIQVLQEECRKMTDEVDLYSDIQVPLGETNEEFYKNIYTGQHGWVLLPPLNAQSHASQNFSGPDNTDHHSRESSGRNRNDPTSPGMHIPRNLPGERVRESTDEGLQSGLGGEGPNWTCSMCTFHNHPALDKCEQCEMPRIILGMPSGGTLISRSPCYPQPNNSLPKRPSDNLHHDSLPAMSEPSHSHPAADSCELRAMSDNLNMPHSGYVVSNSPNSLQSNYNIPKRSFENIHTESLQLDSEPSQNHPVLNSCELQVVPSEVIQ